MTEKELQQELQKKHIFNRQDILNLCTGAVCAYLQDLSGEEVSNEEADNIRGKLFESVIYAIDVMMYQNIKNNC